MQYKDKYKKTIPALLSTIYTQGSGTAIWLMPGNTEANTHAPVGCTAICAAQIIYYWGAQKYGDNTSFTVRNGGWSVLDINNASLGTIDRQGNDCSGYNNTKNRIVKWSEIPTRRCFLDNPDVSSVYDSTSKLYVLTNTVEGDLEFAQFIVDVAMGMPTRFGPSYVDSGYQAYVYNNKFNQFLKGERINTSDSESESGYIGKLEDAIYNELAEGRPVHMAAFVTSGEGGGHAFVIDGYDSGLFHVNLGWLGEGDGWYPLSSISSVVQQGGFHTPTLTDRVLTGDKSKSYTHLTVPIRVFPRNITIQNNYENLYSVGTAPYDDIKMLDIDLSYCDGNIIPIDSTTYKCREQYIRISFINKSENDYFGCNKIGIYAGNTLIDRFYFNAHPGETVTHELVWRPDYTSNTTVTISVKEISTNKILLNLEGNALTESLTFVKRSSYNPLSMDLGYDHFKCYGYSENGMRRVVGNSLCIRFGWSDTTVNPNNYPMCVQMVIWVFARHPSTNSIVEYGHNAGYFYRKIKLIFPANAKGSDVKIPVILENIPKDLTFTIRWGYYDDKLNGYINKYGFYYKNASSINYWTSKGDTCDYILASYDNNALDYSNTDVLVEDYMLAVEFSGITCKSITPNDNPNTVYIFDENQTIPESLDGKNIVRGSIAETINLYEGYDMYFPKTFTANKVIYHYTPVNGIVKGTNKGWKTISFPFDVNKVECEGEEIDWFHSNIDTGKQFWLKGFDGILYNNLTIGSQYEIDWKDVDIIEKNTSYIIAFPGENYGECSLLNKEILFTGNNCTFNKSIGFGYKEDSVKSININGQAISISPENIIDFNWSMGNHDAWNSTNYKQTTRVVDFCGTTLNRNERYVYKLSNDGSTFEYSEDAQNILPFEAYFKDAYRRIYCNEDLYETRPNMIKSNRNNSVSNVSEIMSGIPTNDGFDFVEPDIYSTII